MAPLIEDVCSLVAVAQPGRSVEVVAALPVDAPAVVWGDGKRVRQVLTNLTNNAVKFTETGQVAVSVSSAAAPDGGIVLRFEVGDTGIGIDPTVAGDDLRILLQADGSTTRRYGGTGLGLTIAKQLVILMGGEIGVTSSPGSGSTFFFTLPTRARPPTPRPPTPR